MRGAACHGGLVMCNNQLLELGENPDLWSFWISMI